MSATKLEGSVQASATDGKPLDLPKDVVEAFRGRLRGQLLKAGDPGYDDARSIWNAMIDRRPGLIARCTGTADILACVNFARERGLLISVKGGGHNIAGLAITDGGLLLDLSLMKGVWVDPVGRTARAQPGCLLGDLDRETQLHGLAAVLGFVSNTGIAGLTLGGGFGYLTRKHGWTCDNLVSMEVVTADGRVVRASADEHPDLFWGLRGGGGNFGIVTSFEYKLHAVGPEIMAGAIAWRAADAPKVLEFYRRFAATAPEELALIAGLRPAPPAPWLPKEMHGKPIVAIFACHTGPADEGAKVLAPLKSFGAPVGDIIQRRPYAQMQSLLDATQPKGRRYYWKSEYLGGLEPEALPLLVEHAGRIGSPHSAILVFPLHGALNRLPEDHSPMGNRDAAFVLNIAASWENAADDKANVAWARTTWEAMRRFSTGGVYVNFLTADEGEERTQAAYGKANLERLAAVKAKYDPTNLFRANKNIRPSATSARTR